MKDLKVDSTVGKTIRIVPLPIRMQRRVSVKCPECSIFALHDVLRKVKIQKVVFYIQCSKCKKKSWVSRRENLWRKYIKDYGLTPAQIRILQFKAVEYIIEKDSQGLQLHEGELTIYITILIKKLLENPEIPFQ